MEKSQLASTQWHFPLSLCSPARPGTMCIMHHHQICATDKRNQALKRQTPGNRSKEAWQDPIASCTQDNARPATEMAVHQQEKITFFPRSAH